MNNLPHEVIACLSSFLSGYDLALLWLCGSVALNTRLSRGVQYLSISALQVTNMASDYLPFHHSVPFSGLCHISIACRPHQPEFGDQWILALPPSLKSLHFSFRGALSLFLLPPSHEMASVIPCSLGNEGVCDARDSVLDFKRQFPTLEYLVVHDSSVAEPGRLRDWNSNQLHHLLQTMPETLLTLSLSGRDDLFTKTEWPFLPRSLQAFAVSAASSMTPFGLESADPQIDFSTLPPNTSELHIRLSLLGDIFWFGFPKNLKTLQLLCNRIGLSRKFFEQIPDTLESLSIHHFHSKGKIIGLPTHLKSLNILSPLEPSQAKHLFSNLPKTLKTLKLNRILAQPKFETLPTSITQLHFILEMCPPSLHCLSRLENLIDLSVTQAKANWNSQVTESPIEFETFLPKLRFLQWNSVRTTIKDTFLKMLPPCLESLTLGETIVDPTAIGQKFPDGLLTLNIESLNDPCAWIMGLNKAYEPIKMPKAEENRIEPKEERSTEQELNSRIDGLDGDSDKQLSGENQSLVDWLRSYPLPSRLTSLSMSPPSKLTKFFISRLPRTLTSLSLKNNTIEGDGAIGILPTQLRKLHLRGPHPIQDDNVHLLPRSLTSLSLFSLFDDDNLSDKCIPHLPTGLRVLSLASIKSLSIFGIALLPRSIRVLNLTSIVLPKESSFKSVLEAIQALPPDVDMFCRITPMDIREWAKAALNERNGSITQDI